MLRTFGILAQFFSIAKEMLLLNIFLLPMLNIYLRVHFFLSLSFSPFLREKNSVMSFSILLERKKILPCEINPR